MKMATAFFKMRFSSSSCAFRFLELFYLFGSEDFTVGDFNGGVETRDFLNSSSYL